MALDQTFFDSIQIELVKRKYYNANKVDAVLDEIRRGARELRDENEALKARLGQLSSQREEIGDTLLSAKAIARQILQEAQERAETVLAEARQRAEEIAAEAESRAAERLEDSRLEDEVRRTEACYSRLRELLLGCVDELNADWQDYLLSLGDTEDAPPPAGFDEQLGRIAADMRALDDEAVIETQSVEA